MSPRWYSLGIAISVGMLPSAYAFDEIIVFSQDSSGAISEEISGLIRYCDPQLGYFDSSDPSSAIVDTSITVTSFIYQGECNGEPNPLPPPTSYSYSVLFGNLPDDDYTTDWMYVYKT